MQLRRVGPAGPCGKQIDESAAVHGLSACILSPEAKDVMSHGGLQTGRFSDLDRRNLRDLGARAEYETLRLLYRHSVNVAVDRVIS